MADWQAYHDGELPIPIPPVQLAWEDMRQRLDKERSSPIGIWPKSILTLALLFSWLVLEPLMHRDSVEWVQFSHDPGKPVELSSAVNPAVHANPTPLNENWLTDSTGDRLDQNPLRRAGSLDVVSSAPDRVDPSAPKNSANRTGTTGTKRKTPPALEAQGLARTFQPENDRTDGTQETLVRAEFPAKEPERNLPGDTATKKNARDSLEVQTRSEQAAVQPEEVHWQFRLGPQWELQIPTSGTYGYFHGPDNSPEPWLSLIPGLWLEATHGKDALNFSFMPMHQQMVKDDVFRVQNTLSQSNDTTISREDQKHLYKLLGMSASIGYARNLRGKWWGGLSFQAAWWRQALAISEVQLNYIAAGQVIGQEQFTEPYKITNEWEYFNRMQTFAQADLTYRKQRWQSGLRTGISLTPLSRQSGPGYLFRASVFFRMTFGK